MISHDDTIALLWNHDAALKFFYFHNILLQTTIGY